MFYGGPREAVMHAIYRQNYGFSDLVIGRKHADAPYEDGKPIWGDFDAQQIFDELPGELHLQPCKIGFAAFYESLGRVDLDRATTRTRSPYAISGTKVREQLRDGRAARPAHHAARDRGHPDRGLPHEHEAHADRRSARDQGPGVPRRLDARRRAGPRRGRARGARRARRRRGQRLRRRRTTRAAGARARRRRGGVVRSPSSS